MHKAIIPYYAKISLILLGLVAFAAIMHIAKVLVLLLIFAAFVAVVLHPAVGFLKKIGAGSFVSIAIVLFVTLIIISLLATLMLSQFSRFSDSFPLLVTKFTDILNSSIAWFSGYSDISTKEIFLWIGDAKISLLNRSGSAISSTLLGFGSVLAIVLILPVYIFLILYYQPILLEFFRRLFGEGNRAEVGLVIGGVKTLIQRYLIGLCIEVLIVASLFSAGLLLLGIEYAVILGLIGALLNLIPYIGAIAGAALPMLIALATKPSPWAAVLVLALYVAVQFIDNNYIVPKIVASQVKINVLASLTAVLAFGMLWGIPGMFIAIPLTGVMKLVFDHVDSLKPWGFLLGDTMPSGAAIGETAVDAGKGSGV
jgi:predicted PurR-regulated permease PerM